MVKNLKKIVATVVMFAMICTTMLFTNVYAAVSETVQIDAGSNIGAVDHKANGILLGVTETAPSNAIIQALKPSSWRICDKWDTLTTDDRINSLASSGGYTTQEMDILSDNLFYNYLNTEKSGPFNDAYYTSATNTYLANHNGHGLYSIDLFNEPDVWPYPQSALSTRALRSAYWNDCYRAIRANSNYNNVKIVGPSTSGQSVATVSPFLDDAYASGTYPDIISFHFAGSFPANAAESTIQAIQSYCSSKGYPSRPIQINEEVWSTDWTYPGTIARMFGWSERLGIKVDHACWQDGSCNNGDNNPMLDGLVDLNGNTRPMYWMYKAYADMTGNMLNVTRSTNYDAAASRDTGSKKVVAILGSMNDVSGTVTAQFNNISAVFSGTSVNCLVQKLASGTGIVSGPTTISSGSVAITNNVVNVPISFNSRDGVIVTLTAGSGSGVSEAENASLSGGAVVNTDHTGYSGTGFVAGYYNSTTAQTSFTENASSAGNYTLDLRYSAGNGTSTNTALYVNGTKIKDITCNATADWNTWADETETVSLNASNNTIAYKADTAATACINLDYISIQPSTGKYEAESGTLANGATVASDSAASGGACVQNMHLANASCQINNVNGGNGGSKTLNIIYAANGTGTISIYVNGTLVASPSFPTTGGWSTFTGNLQQAITLNSGTGNTIKFVGGNGGINPDYITIQ